MADEGIHSQDEEGGGERVALGNAGGDFEPRKKLIVVKDGVVGVLVE